MWNTGLFKESDRFLANTMELIQQEVAERDGDEAVPLGAFRLSNGHEIFFFFHYVLRQRLL
jgi:hypothetical protein